ncbi:hypothetical protein OGATHE_002739 [Ogataea polymorpha]|uniref:Uncharacterized protein n=1 Tax=Ogataea polymorpha TaxID=460523 RepID=A0A9P8PEQ3_9ASCO|nr:hypothetical protein OGATHE_002739 [Ogataea polymorpha]
MELKIPQNSSTVSKATTGFRRSDQLSLESTAGLVYHKVHLEFSGCFTLNSSLESRTVTSFFSSRDKSLAA